MRALGFVHGVLLFFAFCLAAPLAVRAETKPAAQKKVTRKKKRVKRPAKVKAARPAEPVIDQAVVDSASADDAAANSASANTKEKKRAKRPAKVKAAQPAPREEEEAGSANGVEQETPAKADDSALPDDAATEAALGGSDPSKSAAVAEEAGETSDAPTMEREVAPLACLREDATPEGDPIRGVQKKDFLKKHRFELTGFGGLYASDTLSSSYTFGGALTFFPGEEFGLEVMATFLPMEYRLEEAVTSFDLERRFSPSRSLAILGGLVYSPIHAKLKLTEQSILHGDIFFVGGAGRTDHDSIQGLTWQVGVGMDLYLKQFLSLRIELRDFIHGQEIFGRAGITNNILWLVGLGLWLG